MVALAVFQLCLFCTTLYDLGPRRSGKDLAVRLCAALGSGWLLLWLARFVLPGFLIGGAAFAVAIALTAVSVLAVRLGVGVVGRLSSPSQRVLIVGSGSLAFAVEQELRRDHLCADIVGVVKGVPETAPLVEGDGKPVLGMGSDLLPIAERSRANRVILAMEEQRGTWPAHSLLRLRLRGVRVEDAHTALAALTGRVWLEGLRPSWFLSCGGFRRSATRAVLKRAADLILGVAGLVMASPLMLVIGIAIKLGSPGPVLYRQRRVGLQGRCFEMLKFRSMDQNAELDGGPRWASPDDPRVTSAGKYLRRFHLDELPQFINVLRGDMSLVGPRPERPAMVERLSRTIPYYDERHTVRPGITGWAQVNYGYGGSVEDALRKVEFDLFYLKNLSLLLDVRILLRTVRIVLLGKSEGLPKDRAS